MPGGINAANTLGTMYFFHLMLNFLIFIFFSSHNWKNRMKLFIKNNNSKHLYFSEYANDLVNMFYFNKMKIHLLIFSHQLHKGIAKPKIKITYLFQHHFLNKNQKPRIPQSICVSSSQHSPMENISLCFEKLFKDCQK